MRLEPRDERRRRRRDPFPPPPLFPRNLLPFLVGGGCREERQKEKGTRASIRRWKTRARIRAYERTCGGVFYGCTSFCLCHSAFSQTAFVKLPWRHTAFGAYCIEDKLPFCHMTLRANYILVILSSVHIAFKTRGGGGEQSQPVILYG